MLKIATSDDRRKTILNFSDIYHPHNDCTNYLYGYAMLNFPEALVAFRAQKHV